MQHSTLIDAGRLIEPGTTKREEQIARYKAFSAADDAWSAELHRLFGKQAGDVRYTKAGKGEPETELRRLHDAFVAAGDAWRAGM